MTHSFALRVYYEDTDMGGIVYYANYLKFIERGRSDWIEALGVDQRALQAEAGFVFAVRAIEADFLRPARFADRLVVETELRSMTGARLVLGQSVLRGKEQLFAATVTLVGLGVSGAPMRLPAVLRDRLEAASRPQI